jgi:2-keto-4-pentenoate hydratase/2-oxohepta-3-ene-1,7-dioic acid hydratase in catechol pathway
VHLVTFEVRNAQSQTEPRSRPLADGALGLEALEEAWPGRRRVGARIPDGRVAGHIVDLNRALAVELALDDVGAPEVEADSLLPSDMLEFLARGQPALEVARRALNFTRTALDRYDGPDLVRAGVVHEPRGTRLAAPIPRPGKLIGVARNYAAHAAELGQQEPPKEPVLFIKATSSVVGPEDDIVLPLASSQVDYEGELGVVIGRPTRDVSSADALGVVAGYLVANDVTARDFQNVRGQRFLGKSCDTFAPLGPTLVTADEIADPQALLLLTTLSGEVRQQASTAEMIFPVAELIAFASRLMTLEPGDVILTGTPAGVGSSAKPPRWLRDGDIVEVEIQAVGRLRNFVRAEAG